MPTVITVERESPTNSSSRSNSFTDEGSSGTGVHVSRSSGSRGDSDLLDDQSWDPVYSADELEPSDSASRPRQSHYRRSDSRQPSARRGPIRRHTTTERAAHRPPISRVHRHPAPNPPSSVDPQEDYPGYGRGVLPPNGAYGGRAPPPGYAPSFVSYSPNPFGGNNGQMMPYGSPSAYPYPQNPFSPAPAVGGAGYFPPHHQTSPHAGPTFGHEIMPYGQVPSFPYGGYGPQGPSSQFYGGAQYIQPHPSSPHEPPAAPVARTASVAPAPPPAPPAPAEKTEIEKKLESLEKTLQDARLEAEKSKLEAEILKRETEEKQRARVEAAEKAKRDADEKKMKELEMLLEATKHQAEKTRLEAEILRRETEEKQRASLEAAEKAKREADEKKMKDLERLLEDTKHAAEKSMKLVSERDAADKKIADDAAAKEVTDKKVKEEVAKVKAEADKKTKAAEEAKTKAEEEKKAADEAKAKAEADAKALSTPKDEKKKPIKFKDAVGRKFSFPFHLCQKWTGMEDLIRQAFMHVEFIGPHVAEGHYDLIGPNGEIILPQVWETMIEPDWAITMHMWPMPEPRQEPPENANVITVDPGHRPPSRNRRRDRADRAGPPPQAPGRRGPPPPPPPEWIGPPPQAMDDIIVVVDQQSTKPRKKRPDTGGGMLGGMFGGGRAAKPSGKGPKKVERYIVAEPCRVM